MTALNLGPGQCYKNHLRPTVPNSRSESRTMAAEYLIQESVEKQVTDISEAAKLDDDDDKGEKADKNLIPLHYAAWYNKLEAVKSLLKYGAGIVSEKTINAILKGIYAFFSTDLSWGTILCSISRSK